MYPTTPIPRPYPTTPILASEIPLRGIEGGLQLSFHMQLLRMLPIHTDPFTRVSSGEPVRDGGRVEQPLPPSQAPCEEVEPPMLLPLAVGRVMLHALVMAERFAGTTTLLALLVYPRVRFVVRVARSTVRGFRPTAFRH
jgi:hypothetical protein